MAPATYLDEGHTNNRQRTNSQNTRVPFMDYEVRCQVTIIF